MTKHQTLKSHLDRWIRVSTWDTLHPRDEERFHRALAACFRDLGTGIAGDEFELAMLELLDEHYPTKEPLDRAPRVDRWVRKAESIGSYLFDTGRPG